MDIHKENVSFLIQLITDYSKNTPLFPRLQSADILMSGGIKENLTQKLFSELELEAQNAGSNYMWKYKENLPPDLDDTVLALNFIYRNTAVNCHSKNHYQNGEMLGKFAKILRSSCYAKTGSGPYFTWITNSGDIRFQDIDYIVNANIISFLAKNDTVPEGANEYVYKTALHELELSDSERKDFIEENTRYYRYSGFRHFLLWKWAKNTNSTLLEPFQKRASKLENIFDMLIVAHTPDLLEKHFFQIQKIKNEIMVKLRNQPQINWSEINISEITKDEMPLFLKMPLYVERVRDDIEEYEPYYCVTISALLVICQKIAEFEDQKAKKGDYEFDQDITYINDSEEAPLEASDHPEVNDFAKTLLSEVTPEIQKDIYLILNNHLKSSAGKWIKSITKSIHIWGEFKIKEKITYLETALHFGWIAMSSKVKHDTPIATTLHLLAFRGCQKININSLSYIKSLTTTFDQAKKHTLNRAEIFGFIIENATESKVCGKIINHLLIAKLLHDDGKDHKIDKINSSQINSPQANSPQNNSPQEYDSIELEIIAQKIIQNVNQAEDLSKSINFDCSKISKPLKKSALRVLKKHAFNQGLMKGAFKN